MSLFSIQINFEKSKLPKNVLSQVANIIAESFCTDTDSMSGAVVHEAKISWQGSTDDVILVNIQTVQNLNFYVNQKCVSALSKYLSQVTNVKANRILINLTEKVYSDVAVDGLLLWQYL